MSGEEEENAAELKIGDGNLSLFSPFPQIQPCHFISSENFDN
jgi:hypothetical protein